MGNFKGQMQLPRVVLYKIVLLEILQNSPESTCAGVSFLIKLQVSACNFIKKETLAQVFSCEICEISNTFSFRAPPVDASVRLLQSLKFFPYSSNKFPVILGCSKCSIKYQPVYYPIRNLRL